MTSTCCCLTNRLCSNGLPSDVIVEVGEMSFHLHKFPLLSRSIVLEDLIGQCCGEDGKRCLLRLDDIPGGAKTFLLVAKFCYGVKIELSALNIVSLRCAAEYLQMSEDHGEGNLITQTEIFLNEIFGNWRDSLKALETCEEVFSHAEEIHIVSRCINSLAMKACADPSLFSWPMSGCENVKSPEVGSNGMKPEKVVGSLMYYARRHLPLLGRQSSIESGNHATPGSTISTAADADQRNLLEELVELLPDQKGVTPSKFLLRLLRTAMILHASPSCRENLEKRIGSQLDQAALEDIMIPNIGYSIETLYDIDCVQRILDHFLLVDRDDPSSNYIAEEGQLMAGSHSLTPTTMVANLIDNYLAEVAPDVNLKLTKFRSLAAVIPDYARPLDDGIYRAIDIYLKAHPWLTDSEREQLCRLMNCQKLSLEASTHAAQNERLPLRVIVQVLFFEQLRLRTSIAGWFFVSDNLESSQNPSGNLAFTRNDVHSQAVATQDRIIAVDEMKERVSELEKECLNMKEEIENIVKTKGSWNIFFRRFGFSKSKLKPNEAKASKPKNSRGSPTSSAPLLNGKKNHSGELGD
ncbi:hypothetical protein GH714_033768 [Hevea brasiliensis]|uniref:NPH3 domain-containing protein n=1 Tax=Hevea brasiliensis TaxID=3981 RepID=A0A6A6L5K2_HEVBR|nr:hypothetical protein GH714_033768 [Hevea brasiliensis]